MTKKETTKKTQYSAPAIDRMLDILEFMAEHSRPFGITELSRELDISTNSVFRIMKRLSERGYAETDPESGGYQLSTRFFSLGMRLYSRFELRLRARPHLEWLCRETEETCQLQVLEGNRMLVLDTINPPIEFFLQIVPGSRVYIHSNAFGKAVLAFMDDEEFSKVLPGKLESLTANTITDKTVLKKELEQIREKGLAYDRDEYNLGIFCIGAPVFNVENKIVAGIGMTGLSSRFNEKKCFSIEREVFICAEKVALDIGYAGDFYTSRSQRFNNTTHH